MPTLKFRTTFSNRLRTGKRSRALNTRTKKIETTNPVLLIDLTYIENLLYAKSQYKMSSLYNKDMDYLIERYTTWLVSAFKLLSPVGVLFLAETKSVFCLKLTVPIIYGKIRTTVYSLLQKQIVKSPICILSNNIDLWALASPSANLSFLAIDSNNRLLYYNHKTGLDIVSRFIGTYKIVNKLKLNDLKYLNLQYLYLLLFYIQFTEAKQSPDFYFDVTFFKLRKPDKQFLKSNGYGLELITTAHKFLSYAFLTKSEFLDYFLLGNSEHYSKNQKRLQKLLPFDLLLLDALKRAYDKQFPVESCTLPKINLQPAISSGLTYSTPSIKKITNPVRKTADTFSDIESYVSNLLQGF